jgi:L-amino acid N-acyltransferase YncA
MTISIKTKILSKEENETVLSFLKQTYGEYDFDFSKQPETTSFLAKDNEKIIGHAAIVKHENYSELRGFIVDPNYRNKGIGTLLEATRAKYILNDPYSEIIKGDIALVNHASQIIKESLGFKVIGTNIGSATSSNDAQRTSQLPALWDVKEKIRQSHQQILIPSFYRDICTRIIQNFGAMHSIQDTEINLQGKTTANKYYDSFGAQKHIITPGNDLETAITELEKENKWLGITLDATKETTPTAIRRLRDAGFFFAELNPVKNPTITLQKLIGQKIDVTRIPIIEPFKEIAEFIFNEYKK